MPWTISYDPERGVIDVEITRPFTSSDLEPLRAELVREGNARDCWHFLVDTRESGFAPSVGEAYWRADAYERGGVPRKLRLAMIVVPSYGDGRFYENVFHNRGYSMRLFTSPSEASAWLLSVPIPQ